MAIRKNHWLLNLVTRVSILFTQVFIAIRAGDNDKLVTQGYVFQSFLNKSL